MRLARYTGVALLVTLAGLFVSFFASDPAVESHDDKQAFIREVTDAAARTPGIGVAQAVQVSLAVLAVLAGVGLYRLVRERAPGLGLAGLLVLVLWGVFEAVQGMVGAAMVTAAGQYVAGGLAEPGSDQTLVLIETLSTLHFGTWLGAWSLLGLAVAGYGYALAWRARLLPRWLGGTAAVAGGLLALTPLALVGEALFIVWFLASIVVFLCLAITGIWLLARRPRVAEPRVVVG